MNGEPPKRDVPFFINNPMDFENTHRRHRFYDEDGNTLIRAKLDKHNPHSYRCPDCGKWGVWDILKHEKMYCWNCRKEFAFGGER